MDVSLDAAALAPDWNTPMTYTEAWGNQAVAIDATRVYRTLVEGGDRYHVAAYNLADGSLAWDRLILGYASSGIGEPSVGGGVVYVNRAGHSAGISGGNPSQWPRLYGLDAATGAVVLERLYQSQWGNTDRPAIRDNQLVLEDGYYGGMASYAANTLTRQWFASGPQLQYPDAAIDDEYLYAWSNWVFRRADGVFVRAITHPQLTTLQEPVVAGSGRLLQEGYGPVNGLITWGVAAYDGNTHALQWTALMPGAVINKAVGNGVVAVTVGRELIFLDEATGARLRTWTAPANLNDEIVLTRTHAFVQSGTAAAATVHAINVATGQQDWSFEHRVAFGGAFMELALAGDRLILSHYSFVRTFAFSGTPPANQPPDAVDDAAAVAEDAAVTVNVRANDTDPNSDPLTVTGVTQPARGSAVLNANGTITYTPAANYFGADSFTYTIGDGRGGTDTAAVNLTVTPANDPPAAQGDAYATDEDVPLTVSAAAGVLANDSDPDGDVTAVLVAPPNYGTVALNPDGSFTYTSAADYHGPDSFTYRAADGTAQTAPVTVALTVRSVNDVPTFTPGPNQTALEDSGAQTVPGWATNLSAGATNETGQALTFLVAADNPALFSVQPAVGPTGTLTYAPAANASGWTTVTVQLRDDGGTASGGVDTGPARTFTIWLQPRPDVTGVVVNRGEVQRSRVTEVAVTFDTVVDPRSLAGAFTLTRCDGVRVGVVRVTSWVEDGRTTAGLTFAGTGTQAGSLADGRWTLRVRGAGLRGSNGALMGADYTSGLHRLFGDADGDREVDAADEAAFNAAYGTRSNQPGYVSYFDFDQDRDRGGVRDIDSKDRTQFRKWLGRSV